MNIYSITDIDGFAAHIRRGAAESIASDYTENLDEYITITQTKNIIVDTSLGVDDDGLYTINEDIFDNIFESIRSAIYQSGLAKLAANGTIECAWDDDTNEMVFWANSANGLKDNEL